jgi:hypothetical protein
MNMKKSYDLNDFLSHDRIISDLADSLWNENSEFNKVDYDDLIPYLKEIPSNNIPPNAIFTSEDEYILVPENTPLKILMLIYVRDIFEIDKGNHYVAIISIGDFTMAEDYIPKPQYCYATLYYRSDKTLIKIDCSFEESWLNFKFE